MISWSMLKVVRWTLRISSHVAGMNKRHLSSACQLMSHVPNSTTTRELRQGSQLSVRSLLDLGFTDAQAEQVIEGVIQCQKKSLSSDITTITALLTVGLNPSSIVKIFDKCSSLHSESGELVQQRIQNLWKLGIVEGSIQRVVSHYPNILTLPTKKVNAAVQLLRTKCLFTAQQIRDIIRDSPEMASEDLHRLEYKFQYAYFRMGIRQAEMVKAALFRISMEELRCRHCFLERRGLYQTPDKKGQTLIVNPKLKDMLWTTEEVYLAQVARATKEELDVFRQLIAREDEEEGRLLYKDVEDIDEAEEDKEEEEEDLADLTDFRRGNQGKEGYAKTKKKK